MMLLLWITLLSANPLTYQLEAELAFSAGEWERGAQILEKGIRETKDPDLVRILIQAAFDARRYPVVLQWAKWLDQRNELDSLSLDRSLRAAYMLGDRAWISQHARRVLNTQDADLLALMGSVYQNLDVYDSARLFYEKALQLTPDSTELLGYYGFVLLHLGALDRADSIFQRVKSLGDTALADRGLGMIAEQRGDLEKALVFYQNVLRKGGQDPQVTLKVATLLLRMQRYDEAIPHLLFLRDLNPLNAPVQKLLAQAYLGNNQPSRALVPLGFLAYLNPADPEPHLLLSRVYMGLRKTRRALQEAKKALDLAKTREARRQARENLALLYLNLGRPRKAAEVFTGIAPAFLSVEELLLRAQALEESGAPSRAVQMLGRAYRFRKDPRLAREQARILAQQGKLQHALRLLDQLKVVHPEDPSIRFLRALVLTDLGRGHEALQEYDTLLQRDSLNPTYLNNSGYLMLQLGEDLERAGERIRKALQLQPDVPSYLDSMGWYYFLKGDLTRAKKYLEQALDLGGGDDPEILEHLGDLYWRMDEPERAKNAWRRALRQADPSMRARLERKLRQRTLKEEEEETP